MKMKISIWQLVWLAFSFQIGLSLLLTERPAIRIARQDTWICVFIAGVGALGIALVAWRISSLYPNQTLIEFSQSILGRWIGKVIVIPYFIMWFVVTGFILRQFSDFVHIAMFSQTPLWALILPFVILGMYATKKGGIEVIGRCSELIGPMIVVIIVALVFLNWGNMRFEEMRPVYVDSGLVTLVRGSIPILAFFGEIVLTVMTIPFLDKPEKALRGILIAGCLTVVFVALSIVVTLATFGPNLASRMLYPAYEVVRYSSTMEFIQNIDVLVVMVWFFAYFIKFSSYFFFLSYGLGQWLQIKNWQNTIWFVAVIVTVIAMWPRHYNIGTIEFGKKFWIPYVLPVNMVGIPLFLCIVALIRKKFQPVNGTKSETKKKQHSGTE